MTQAPKREAGLSILAQVLRQPQRFRFDAAIRVLLRAAGKTDPGDAARFRSTSSLAFPAADITAIEPGDPPRVTAGLIGMAGASGVLPRFYTELLAATLRGRSRAMHDFIDLLGQRLVAMYARGGSKYRLHRAAELASAHSVPGVAGSDPISLALLSLTGFGTADLADRVLAGADPLMHYAGLFATGPRAADRLAALASDWLGRPVEVVQFAGAWLEIAPEQRTTLSAPLRRGSPGEAWNRLGRDAVCGVRTFDVQARVVLRIGPLEEPSFRALLPDGTALPRLVSLVRCFLGWETGFAINPVLAAASVPMLRLDAPDQPGRGRLGWNTWLAAGTGRVHDGSEPLFEADMVERQSRSTPQHV